MIAIISLTVLIFCAVGVVVCVFELLVRRYAAKRDAQIKRFERPTGPILPPIAQDRGLSFRPKTGSVVTYRYGGPPSGTMTGRLPKPRANWDIEEALPRVDTAFHSTFEKLAKGPTEDD